MLRAVNPAQIDRPCGTCGQELNPDQPAYHCSICRLPVCGACAQKDGYTQEPPQLDPDDPNPPVLISWDLDRRDFLIREIKEQVWNAQQGRCGQCGQSLTDIAQTSIMNSPVGPMLMCDRPCAAQAMGKGITLQPGSYPTDPIKIVADPRHGIPQDWLNVHFEMSLPPESDEVWSQADCRFAVELYADPDRWDFFGECVECRMASYGNGRPHKWCQTTFFLQERPAKGRKTESSKDRIFSAQGLLGHLGDRPADLPGVTVRYGNPECLEYWGIQPPRRF